MLKFKEKIKEWMIAFVRHYSEKSPSIYGDSYWYAGPNLWEPTVMLALRDLCKPGATVFDVGGNMGGLTSAMSRLVGPKGVVCTFEASPRIIGHLQGNVASQGHNNVYVYNRAVYSKSSEIINIYDGDHLNDSIYVEQSPNKVGRKVETLALDDFCEASGLAPELIKMDIEGAEYDALLGALRVIDKHRPHFILEQQASDTRCFDFLSSRGYLTIDLSNYRQIHGKSDYPENSPLRNVLCVHESKLSDTSYKLPIQTSDVMVLDGAAFRANHLNGLTSSTFVLDAGRYLLDVNFSAEGTENNMMCGVRCDGADLFRYHGYSKLLADSYREWIIDVPSRSTMDIYFDFYDSTSDPSLVVRSVSIKKTSLSSDLWARLVMN